ncbi:MULTISPECIES: hypothetical protein [Thalassobaculum]|nr:MULTISPECIES: hypothetical protein [Thalassobaculum]
MVDYIPSSFGAISAPLASQRKGDVVAHHAAAGLLQTDAVAIIHTVADGKVHALFAQSTDFPQDPSKGDFTCALAAALPGHSRHQGDGVYITESSSGYAAVRTAANSVASFHGNHDLVLAWAADQGLPRFFVEPEDGSPWRLPMYQREQRQSRLNFALTMSGLAFAVFAAFNLSQIVARDNRAAQDTAEITNASRGYERELRTELGHVAGQPALAVIGRLYSLSRIVPETGGALSEFRAEGDTVKWTAEVPDWVSNEQIDSYGPDIQRTRLPTTQKLRLTAVEKIQ